MGLRMSNLRLPEGRLEERPPRDDSRCPVCWVSPMVCPVKANCNHLYCLSCLQGVAQNTTSSEEGIEMVVRCPTCRSPVRTFQIISSTSTAAAAPDSQGSSLHQVAAAQPRNSRVDSDMRQASSSRAGEEESTADSTDTDANSNQHSESDSDKDPFEPVVVKEVPPRRRQRGRPQKYEIAYVLEINGHRGCGRSLLYRTKWTDGKVTWEPPSHFYPAAKASAQKPARRSGLEMGATVLESLSNTKLAAIICILLAIQLVSFYIGAFLTPSPSSFEQFTAVHCHRHNREDLAIPRHHKSLDLDDVGSNCNRSASMIIESEASERRTGFNTTTFAAQLPLPRDRIDLAYSRWMQTLLVLLIPEFKYEPLLASSMFGEQQVNYHLTQEGIHVKEGEFTLLVDVDVAVKNRDDQEWTMYAQRRGLRRTMRFHSHDLRPKQVLDCEPVQLFELQSLHYEYYLINFEIREDTSTNKSFQLTGFTGVAIHHNGGFTQIWLSLKTVFFTLTLATLIWYCGRLCRLDRPTILIERLLVGLGATLTQLNFPAELLSLWIEIPFMTFLNDLRQGVFYCVLFSFWIIFVGEHLLDGTRKDSRLSGYLRELLAICVASLALLIFDLSERGIQAFDPFLTIWESKPNLASISIAVASCACLAYLGFLLYYIYLAFDTISGKQNALPKMQITKRLKYQGMIYRFKFLLAATAICATGTLVFYALSHRNDWSFEDSPAIEWTSAMLTTVCAMWNSYVIVLMILYAPSYKGIVGGGAAGMPDQIEFDCLTDDRDDEIMEGDMNLLQELANKSNLD